MSRGEECRLAMHVAGMDFEDARLERDAWLAMKPSTPFGSVLVFVGRTHGLHPADDFEAARHGAMMGHVEDLRAMVTPTLHMTDAAQRKKAREELAASYLPVWAEPPEKQIEDGPFFAGAKLHVVDLELHMAVRWFAGGNVDHIPATILAGYPKLMRARRGSRRFPRQSLVREDLTAFF